MLTFIGKNLDKVALKEGFMSCMATAENREKRIKMLRFAKGDKVECIDDDGEWVTGVVEDHLFRNEVRTTIGNRTQRHDTQSLKLTATHRHATTKDWAPGQCAPYAVKLDGADMYIYPTEDDDSIVRAVE